MTRPLLLGAALASVLSCQSGKSGAADPYAVEALRPASMPAVLEEYGSFPKVKLPAQPILLEQGAPGGFLVVEEFADFRCPHCYDTARLLKRAAERWPGRIRIVLRNFPLDATCNPLLKRKQEGGQSCRAAMAVICAAEQNRFGEMQAGLFALQQGSAPIDAAAVRRIIESAGGRPQALEKCMQSDAAERSLLVDLAAARRIRIQATPTLVVGGRLLPPGAPGPRAMFHLLDALVYRHEGIAVYDELVARQRR